MYYCDELICDSSWLHNTFFFRCVFSRLMKFNGTTTGLLNCNATNMLVKARRSGLTGLSLTYPRIIKTVSTDLDCINVDYSGV